MLKHSTSLEHWLSMISQSRPSVWFVGDCSNVVLMFMMLVCRRTDARHALLHGTASVRKPSPQSGQLFLQALLCALFASHEAYVFRVLFPKKYLYIFVDLVFVITWTFFRFISLLHLSVTADMFILMIVYTITCYIY